MRVRFLTGIILQFWNSVGADNQHADMTSHNTLGIQLEFLQCMWQLGPGHRMSYYSKLTS